MRHYVDENIWYVSIFFVLLLSCIALPGNIIAEDSNDLEWSVTLLFTESGGKSDNVIFGEAYNASDELDVYDAPDLGGPPGGDYMNSYFTTSFPDVHSKLMQEIKQYSYISTYKVWNLSVDWEVDGSDYGTNVTISWDIGELRYSNYDSAVLMRKGQLNSTWYNVVDMLAENSFSYDHEHTTYGSAVIWFLEDDFRIICKRPPNNPPDTPSEPYGETDGYHGISYTYNTSTTDPDGNNIYYLLRWGDGTNSGWIGPYSSGEFGSISHVWESPGIYTIGAKAKDRYGAESNWSSYLMVNMSNRAPNIPTNPTPSESETGVNVNMDLSWTGGDPDLIDIVTYDVYFGNSSPPLKVISNKSAASFDPGTMSYAEDYYWKITSWDNHGLKTSGPIWSFTTGSHGGGDDDDHLPTVNQPPVANASASDSFGFVGSLMIFNGSLSIDSDGYITSWSWDFGDDTIGSGEVATHAYLENGTYVVKLTVTDDDDTTDTDIISVMIGTANNPPLTPTVSGITSGNANTKYTYIAISTDPDNDTICYIFDWGDGIKNKSGFLPNGTTYTTTHKWISAGIYTVNVTATDNKTTSKTVKLIVSIDAEYADDLGYLLDINGDEIYDLFYSNITKTKTTVEKQDGGNYSIDVNGDGNWDYTYNPTEGTITPIKKEKEITGNTSNFPTGVILVMIMVSITIVVITYLYKKEYL